VALGWLTVALGVGRAGLTRPSKIQTIAFPHVLDGSSCIIAEQTGAGKTLAYMLPLLQVRPWLAWAVS
jgi:superfamily II DNA/RNA helicase